MSGISISSSDFDQMRAVINAAGVLMNSEGTSNVQIEENLVAFGQLQSGPLRRIISFSLENQDTVLQVEAERFASLVERFTFVIQQLWFAGLILERGDAFLNQLDMSTSGMADVTYTSSSKPDARPTHFLLVRHGETPRNKEGKEIQGWVNDARAALNVQGQAQAERLGKKMGEIYNQTIKHIYYSPLIRSEETARKVAKFLKNPFLISEPRFKEIGHGQWETFSYQKRNEMGKIFYEKMRRDGSSSDRFSEWKVNPLGCTEIEAPLQREEKAFESKLETVWEVFERATAALKELAKRHPGETVLIVTHAGVITTLVDETIHRERNDSSPMPVYYLSPTKIGNCSVTHLILEDDKTRLLEIKNFDA